MITIFFLYVRSVRIQTNIEHTGIGLCPHATVVLQQSNSRSLLLHTWDQMLFLQIFKLSSRTPTTVASEEDPKFLDVPSSYNHFMLENRIKYFGVNIKGPTSLCPQWTSLKPLRSGTALGLASIINKQNYIILLTSS